MGSFLDLEVIQLDQQAQARDRTQVEQLVSCRHQVYGLGSAEKSTALSQEDLCATHVFAYVRGQIAGGTKFIPYSSIEHGHMYYNFIKTAAYSQFLRSNGISDDDVCIAGGWFTVPSVAKPGLGLKLARETQKMCRQKGYKVISAGVGTKLGQNLVLSRIGFDPLEDQPMIYDKKHDDNIVLLNCLL